MVGPPDVCFSHYGQEGFLQPNSTFFQAQIPTAVCMCAPHPMHLHYPPYAPALHTLCVPTLGLYTPHPMHLHSTPPQCAALTRLGQELV